MRIAPDRALEVETMEQKFVFSVGVTEDGRHYAYSAQEPLFCIECASKDEAIKIGEAALASYRSRFLRDERALTPRRVNLNVRRVREHEAYEMVA